MLTSTSVDLSWTPTTSAFADGYEILRSATTGGPYVSIATLASTATTYTDSTVTFSTPYHYVVKATRNLWRSAASNEASVTTPTALCI